MPLGAQKAGAMPMLCLDGGRAGPYMHIHQSRGASPAGGAISSVGRALCSHRRGHWFESSIAHHFLPSPDRSFAFHAGRRGAQSRAHALAALPSSHAGRGLIPARNGIRAGLNPRLVLCASGVETPQEPFRCRFKPAPAIIAKPAASRSRKQIPRSLRHFPCLP